jgi:hypothetical protein
MAEKASKSAKTLSYQPTSSVSGRHQVKRFPGEGRLFSGKKL